MVTWQPRQSESEKNSYIELYTNILPTIVIPMFMNFISLLDLFMH